MKNSLVALIVGLVLVPSSAFALTPQEQYRTSLQQLITLLTAKLDTLIAQLAQLNAIQSSIAQTVVHTAPQVPQNPAQPTAPIVPIVPVVPSVSVTLNGESSSGHEVSGTDSSMIGWYGITLAVTASGSDVWVPITGQHVSINAVNNSLLTAEQASAEAIFNPATCGGSNQPQNGYCIIPAGTTGIIGLTGQLHPSKTGTYQMLIQGLQFKFSGENLQLQDGNFASQLHYLKGKS